MSYSCSPEEKLNSWIPEEQQEQEEENPGNPEFPGFPFDPENKSCKNNK